MAGGWGNLGGGITNMLMPVIFTVIVGFGYTKPEAWRYAMIVPGVLMLLMAFLYFRYTKDTPAGNYDEIKRDVKKVRTDYTVLRDWRIWALTLAYAVCSGISTCTNNATYQANIFCIYEWSDGIGGAIRHFKEQCK